MDSELLLQCAGRDKMVSDIKYVEVWRMRDCTQNTSLQVKSFAAASGKYADLTSNINISATKYGLR